MTQALLPALIASGDGVVVNMGSTAGHGTYEGGGGYAAAKHGVAALTQTLRLELLGKPVRITEIAPGMVRTEEFGLVRFGGDEARRDAVYAGVPEPLTADDIADAVTWVATRPSHVNIDLPHHPAASPGDPGQGLPTDVRPAPHRRTVMSRAATSTTKVSVPLKSAIQSRPSKPSATNGSAAPSRYGPVTWLVATSTR